MNHPNLYEQIQTDIAENSFFENWAEWFTTDGGMRVGYRFKTSAGLCLEILHFWNEYTGKFEDRVMFRTQDNYGPYPLPWAAVCWGQLKMRAAYEQRTAS